MTGALTAIDTPKRDFKIDRLDLSRLVGFQLKVYSDQLPGKELRTRVASATENILTVESGAKSPQIDNLVSNRRVILQFPYRGQDISVRALLRRTAGGRCTFELDGSVTPLSQRRFLRIKFDPRVTLAPFPSGGLMRHRLSRLRWMETDGINFSAGGALIELPSPLDSTARLLVNFKQNQFKFPALVLAKVRHSYQADEHNCHIGIEFVTVEAARRMFSPFQMADMPPVLFTYGNAGRERLNRLIREIQLREKESQDTGATHE